MRCWTTPLRERVRCGASCCPCSVTDTKNTSARNYWRKLGDALCQKQFSHIGRAARTSTQTAADAHRRALGCLSIDHAEFTKGLAQRGCFQLSCHREILKAVLCSNDSRLFLHC